MLNLGIDSWRLVSMDPIGRAKENDELLLNGEEIKKLLTEISSVIFLLSKRQCQQPKSGQ